MATGSDLITQGSEEETRGRKQPPPQNDSYITGTPYTQSQLQYMPYWQQGVTSGLSLGHALFYGDPDMADSRKRLEELRKGYSGTELSALRESARQNVAGQRQGYLNQLRSNLARGGSGGARGAAVMSAADQRFAQTAAENERKMALDNANLVRQGTQNLHDFIMKQKYGQLVTGAGFGQLASADDASRRGMNAANSGDDGMCFITTAVCEILGLPDDNDILNTFRKFRDEFMGGKEAVKEYYEVAPKIVSSINALPDKQEKYIGLFYGYLVPAFVEIRLGNMARAEEIYSKMVRELQKSYL